MDPTNRRWFLERAAFGMFALADLGEAREPKRTPAAGPGARKDSPISTPARDAVERCVMEWAYFSGRAYADPFNDIELDVVFTGPNGQEQRVPAFWAGEQVWRIRYAAPTSGRGRFLASVIQIVIQKVRRKVPPQG